LTALLRIGVQKLAIFSAISVLMLCPAISREPRRDPISGRVRILYYGDAFAPSPYPAYVADPMTYVVALTGMYGPDVERKMRVFMPRSYKDLLSKYDFMIISDAIVANFRPEYIQWLRDSVIEDGLGLIMIGGHYTFGSRFGESPWGETVLQDALPCLCPTEGWAPGSHAGRLKIVRPDNVFARSLPFEEMGPFGVFYFCNVVIPKEGSERIADYIRGETYPLLLYQELGEGASIAMTVDWTPDGGRDFIRWPYYADYALNIALYGTGNQIPQDLELAHAARLLLNDYHAQISTLHSVMDFVGKFGVNLASAERMLGDIDAAAKAGRAAYIDADLQGAVTHMEEAMGQLGKASDEIWRLRYEALAWIYVAEWLAVAGTGMICGFVVWTLMVRRRLYKETEATRLRQRAGQ
jgi:uncharacterized membrane protein